ncbi:glutathione S-transferase [Halomonas halmophila]|uniref:glutathione transferase n=1 Tax=Halomonas halmophila TaxID=252 RepID=A0A4Y4F6A7_9GAMM|nr:glutathione S-transferase [Halomonas halmophila]GED23150.1 glutathione S-transferase [Halomonas halmophila]
MIHVHHLESSRSQRVIWCLEELGMDYELVNYQRDPQTKLAPASLKQVHPLGKAPVISDASRGDRVIAESGAILEYLVEHPDAVGQLKPEAGTEALERYRFWLHHAEGSAMPPLVMRLVFSRLDKPPVPWPMRPLGRQFAKGIERSFLTPRIREFSAFWNDALAESPWFAGDTFTAADIQMSFPIQALEGRGGLDSLPNLQAFLERCRAREAYQRASETGGDLSAI